MEKETETYEILVIIGIIICTALVMRVTKAGRSSLFAKNMNFLFWFLIIAGIFGLLFDAGAFLAKLIFAAVLVCVIVELLRIIFRNNCEVASLKMQINVVEQELDAAYTQIGRKFVEHALSTGNTYDIGVDDLLVPLDAKIARKEELEKELAVLEKRMNEQNILREKEKETEKFQAEKTKLDRALAMDAITQDEYNYKLSIAQKRVEHFEEIRRIETQFSLGIITREEKEAKIQKILE